MNTKWFSNGQLRMKDYFGNAGFRRQSVWYENGQLSHDGPGHGGSGEHSEWYEGGEVQAVGNIDSGVKVGVWEYYNKDGTIEEAGEYVDGVRSGEWTSLGSAKQVLGKYFDGKPCRGSYRDGKLHGRWVCPTTKSPRTSPELYLYFESGKHVRSQWTGLSFR